MCGLRIRPRMDVDPPRVELPSGGGQSSRRPRGDNLLVLRPRYVRSVNCPFASCCFMFTYRVSGKSIAIGRVRSFHFNLT